MGDMRPSSWRNFPTEQNPENLYKYLSVEFNMNPDRIVWNRQTYSFLDWLGDLGGLFDALMHLSSPIVAPLSVFAL